MKNKIMLFIIGVLVGAVIATGAFYIYTTTTNSCDCSSNNMEMNGMTPPDMPNGERSEMPSGEPPERPNDNNMPANTRE